MIENEVSPVLLLVIVKYLIKFEREMVIEFTDNTMVLDMKYDQFYFMGWIGGDWEIKTNDYFGKVRKSRLVRSDIQRKIKE